MKIKLAKLDPRDENRFEGLRELLDDGLFDLILLNEGFIQGPLSFNYEEDIHRASSLDSEEIIKMRSLAKKHKTAIGFGFYENLKGGIFNSYMLVGKDGELEGLARSISRKWVDESQAYNADYRKADSFTPIELGDKKLMVFISYDLAEGPRLNDAIDFDNDDYIRIWVSGSDIDYDRAHEISQVFVEDLYYLGLDKRGRLYQGRLDKEDGEIDL